LSGRNRKILVTGATGQIGGALVVQKPPSVWLADVWIVLIALISNR
jgi:FlaA1/EpsC-like NDP-sugar epimerase